VAALVSAGDSTIGQARKARGESFQPRKLSAGLASNRPHSLTPINSGFSRRTCLRTPALCTLDAGLNEKGDWLRVP